MSRSTKTAHHERKRLMRALKPFAAINDYIPFGADDAWPLIVHVRHANIHKAPSVRDVRRAAKLLKSLGKKDTP